jgi:flagellar biosynthesis protein FlhF
LYKRAGERALDDTIAKRLVRQLLSDLTGVEMTNPKAVVDKAKELLLPGIHGVQAVNFQGATPRKVAFIGPTGAGKTTSLAKLATDFTLNGEKKVSMLTIDSNRVDGFSQLKAYARIIDVKLHIAYTADEIPEVLPECRKDDIVLIDTPGIGPLDREGMLETAQFLEEIDPHEIHLVLSATTALPELKRAYESFSEMKPNRILFSKLDETDRYGAMLSFVLMAKQPLSYVTLGRNVPGDFSEAEPELIVQETLEPKKES